MAQQYPDALMLRLASALARFITKDPNSPTTSTPASPAPRKQSLKAKPSWRSASVHTDGRAAAYRCPFTATNALTAATKKEIDAYNSSEEIGTHRSTDRINEGKELQIAKSFHRRSLAITLADRSGIGSLPEIEQNHDTEKVLEEKAEENTAEEKPADSKEATKSPDESAGTSAATSPDSEGSKRNSFVKPSTRKVSCTVALDVYKRRGSGVPVRQRLNSLSLISEDKLTNMREKFGTPEKVMHFFGRCFVKFFSNYG